MNYKAVRSYALLSLAAAIWGFAFVAQRVGAASLGPFAFNAARFALGALSLLPALLIRARGGRARLAATAPSTGPKAAGLRTALPAGLCVGAVLFAASTFQQMGLSSTTAGKAGFLTGLYIVFVPILGLFCGHRARPLTWLAVLLAAVGLYFVSVTGGWRVASGDLLEICGAAFWAVHILLIDRFSARHGALQLSFWQFAVCSALSALAACLTERPSLSGFAVAAVPLLYGGILSSGVAFTLQVVAQKHAKPSAAAIVMSMESVFALIGGVLLLSERMSVRSGVGCVFLVAGMVLAQLPARGTEHGSEAAREVA